MGRSTSTIVLFPYQKLGKEIKHSTVRQTRKIVVEWYQTGLASSTTPMESMQVPIANRQQGFYRNRGDQIIRLNRREGIMSPTGTYRCEIPNADDEKVKIYITLTE